MGPARSGARHVRLNAVRVAATPAEQGFFVAIGSRHVFVLPAQPIAVTAGTPVTVDGIILRLPRGIVRREPALPGLNEDVYVYALSVTT